MSMKGKKSLKNILIVKTLNHFIFKKLKEKPPNQKLIRDLKLMSPYHVTFSQCGLNGIHKSHKFKYLSEKQKNATEINGRTKKQNRKKF